MTIAFLILSFSSTVSTKTTTPDKASAVQALSGQDKLYYTSFVSPQCDNWISGDLPNNIIEKSAKELEIKNKYVFHIEPVTRLYVSIDYYQQPKIYVVDVHFERTNIGNENEFGGYEYVGPVYVTKDTALTSIVLRKNDLVSRLESLIDKV